MKIIIDGKEKKFDQAGVDNLKTLFDLIYDEIGSEKRVVLKIFLDGKELSPEKEAEMENESTSGFQKIEFETATRKEIAKSGVGESLKLIEAFNAGLSKITEDLRAGKASRIGQNLIGLLGELDDLLEIFSSVRETAGINLKKITSNGMQLDEIESDLIIAISKLAETGQGGGIDSILDSINSRLVPAIENFEKFLLKIKVELER